MKPTLTPDLKERFFALHHKQRIVMDSEWEQLGLPPYMCYSELYMTKKNGPVPYLLLRPLASIKENEAIEVAKIAANGQMDNLRKSGWIVYRNFGTSLVSGTDGYFEVSHKNSDYQVCIDIVDGDIEVYEYNPTKMIYEDDCLKNLIWAYQYLTSISIALPYFGHSVEELCSAGWVKLIENKTSKP